ncbi:arginine--tRNA ligase [Clostridium sp. CAG:470]|nr:MAG: arginine--tRNA ligase [Clostridium sp. 28_17]CDE15172.1 arginine--tRNA ligase [Clostridium sp. CAG:470]
MKNFKQIIAKQISKTIEINAKELEGYIETPKDSKNGDYAFPCFRLAKELRKAPPAIADEIKEKIEPVEEIEKVEVAGGYLNFFINKSTLAEEVLGEISKTEQYGKSIVGEGKNIVIDYSAPNIAKPFHIGHLRSTVIGGALYNIYKYLGYNVTGVNHLGDYGTQFGKLIEGYKMWGEEYDIEKDPINELTKIYIRINEACKNDEQILENCRNNFKKLEDGDSYCVEIWKKFRKLSLQEFQKVYDLLGSKFDSWNGESFYSDKMPEVIDLLKKTGKLVESQGAKIIDLEDKGINTPCIIEKSNGSTTYATRDLAAILYRARTYDFDKALYVTSYEQVLHFKQVFEVAKLLGLDEKYTNGLEHVSFGMVLLPEGKMSTREGNIIKLEELLNEAISRAKEIIEQKNPDLENKEEVAKKVGIGAVIFNDMSASRIKDEVFDWNTILNFQGETGPYIQYTYVRTKSVLEKAGYLPKIENVKIDNLSDEYSMAILKLIYNFEDILIQVTDKNEPSILARYLIELAKAYSSFYNENKIIVDDKDVQDARVYLTYAVSQVLKQGANLLGIEMPEKM